MTFLLYFSVFLLLHEQFEEQVEALGQPIHFLPFFLALMM
jgi:hypothetical protein